MISIFSQGALKPGRPAPRHVRPLHAQGARHGKPGSSGLKPGPQGSQAPLAGLFSWGSGWAGLARKAQSSALGPQRGKVQGSSALRLGFNNLGRKAFCLAVRRQMPERQDALPCQSTTGQRLEGRCSRISSMFAFFYILICIAALTGLPIGFFSKKYHVHLPAAAMSTTALFAMALVHACGLYPATPSGFLVNVPVVALPYLLLFCLGTKLHKGAQGMASRSTRRFQYAMIGACSAAFSCWIFVQAGHHLFDTGGYF